MTKKLTNTKTVLRINRFSRQKKTSR